MPRVFVDYAHGVAGDMVSVNVSTNTCRVRFDWWEVTCDIHLIFVHALDTDCIIMLLNAL